MYHDDMDLRKIGFASLIVAGVIGPQHFRGTRWQDDVVRFVGDCVGNLADPVRTWSVIA